MPFTPALGELDHLAGLDLVEAEDAGDAVADRQHLADVGDVGFLAEVGDLGLEDGRDLGGADVHGSLRSLQGELQGIELRLQRGVVEARADPHLQPAQDGGVDAGLDFGVLAAAPGAARRPAPFDWAAVSGTAVVTWAATAPRSSAARRLEGGDHARAGRWRGGSPQRRPRNFGWWRRSRPPRRRRPGPCPCRRRRTPARRSGCAGRRSRRAWPSGLQVGLHDGGVALRPWPARTGPVRNEGLRQPGWNRPPRNMTVRRLAAPDASHA